MWYFFFFLAISFTSLFFSRWCVNYYQIIIIKLQTKKNIIFVKFTDKMLAQNHTCYQFKNEILSILHALEILEWWYFNHSTHSLLLHSIQNSSFNTNISGCSVFLYIFSCFFFLHIYIYIYLSYTFFYVIIQRSR